MVNVLEKTQGSIINFYEEMEELGLILPVST